MVIQVSALEQQRKELLEKLENLDCEPHVAQQILQLQADEAQWHADQVSML